MPRPREGHHRQPAFARPQDLGKSLRALADQVAAKSKGKRPIIDDPEEGEKLGGAEYEIEKQRFELQSYLDRIRDMSAAISTLLAQQIEDAVYWVEATGKTNRRLKFTGSPITVPTNCGRTCSAKKANSKASFSRAPRSPPAAPTATPRQSKTKNQNQKSVSLPPLPRRTRRRHRSSSRLSLRLRRAMHPVSRSRPAAADEDGFLPAAMDRALHYLRQSQGRAFLLFTSYQMLDQAAKLLAPQLAPLGYPLFQQGGQLTRGQLLARFKTTPNSVLLGTDSFWQGVDVQGEALSNVTIVKLPFDVPDKPLTEARLDAIRAAGGNPFAEFSLPEAIIKFKQGFGRLIRSKTDTGIVVVLDKRIVTKHYGRQFIAALPGCKIHKITV